MSNTWKKWLSALVVGLVPFYLVRFKIGLPTTLFEVVIWLIFSYLIIYQFKLVCFAVQKIDRLIAAGSILIILGSLIGVTIFPDKILVLGQIKGVLITPMLAGLIILTLCKESKNWLKLSLTIPAAVVGGQAFWQFIQKINLEGGRAVGIFQLDSGASPNYLALYLAPIAGLVAFSLIQNIFKLKNSQTQNRIINYYLYFSLFILICLGLFASGSRAGLMSVGLIIFYALWVELKKIRKIRPAVNFFAIIVAVLALLIIYQTGFPNLKADPNSGRIASSNNIRYEIWKTTIREILPKYWLTGLGIGRYQTVFSEITFGRVNYNEYIAPKALSPHNLFLAVWLNLGLAGLVGFILVIYQTLRRIPFSSPWFAYLMIILLLGIFDTPVFKNDTGTLFWLVVAIGQLCISKSEADGKK